MEQIDFNHFFKVDIRVGQIVSAKEFPEARKPAYKLEIDFGNELGIKKSSAQITDLYNPEDLLNTKVVAVVNFPVRQIGPFMSEVLVLGAYTPENAVGLLSVHDKIELGARVC